MASCDGDSHKSRSHPTNALQKSFLRPSEIPRPAYHTRTTANVANSHSSTEQTPTVVGSRISKHRGTTAGDPKRETGTRSKVTRNAYQYNKPTGRATTQEIMVVHLNNRLGRRITIQCIPKDTIKTLKILASWQSGIRPEAMMLKRQGQRALRDELTLEDYEIGNGSSVDLEIDTED